MVGVTNGLHHLHLFPVTVSGFLRYCFGTNTHAEVGILVSAFYFSFLWKNEV
jgi:hypothetical protein